MFHKESKEAKKGKKPQKRACNLLSLVLYCYQFKGQAQTVADLLKVGDKSAKAIIVSPSHFDKHLTKGGYIMATIKVHGTPVSIDSKNDLRVLRDYAPDLYQAIRTADADLIKWAYELYLDELDAQDAKASTGSYGKHAEVYARVNDALENHKRIWLHDIRCRRPGMDDHRAAGVRYEYKTGFAQWAYGSSYDECMAKLQRMAAAGIVMRWEPFKDERVIEMPLSDLLEVLASYNPDKGLAVWFSFKPARNQLQIQPVNLSKKRAAFIESLL